MGIEDEKIDQIIDAHTEVTDALKAERDKYKADAEKLPDVQKELDDLKANPDDGFKEKYESEHKAFKAYQEQVATEKAENEKRALYRKVLQEAGVDAKRIDTVMRVADLASVTVKDGEIENRDDVLKAVKTDWADFIPQSGTSTAKPDTPPNNTGGADPEPHSIAEAMRQKYHMK